ncbi:glycosyltransferase family 4 protein [Achromobacter sp. B7]|uniref:glycosyltransferase family 4 protein n=1 Tax=Achromobacter sp. B7 TaxID=2282475 RepID=UPI001F091392|nr:glycosyltransferase family 4 protein [Achromobacter sp. B7]
MNLARIPKLLKAANRYRTQHGLVPMCRHAVKAMRRQALGQSDILRQFSFVLETPVGKPFVNGDAAPNTVNWFIPAVGRGSGGHLNIFRFVRYLEQLGFECRLIITDAPGQDPAAVERDIASWFFPLAARVYIGSDHAPPAHISLATAWHTAYDVRNFQSTLHKCYFVQDFEPWFFPSGSASTFAEETYRFGFTGITAGSWLADVLHRDYGMPTHAIGFSYDRDLYKPLPRSAPAQKRVFFYARPNTPRRSFELGILVLAEVVRRIPSTHVVLAGADLSEFKIPFAYENPGIVDIADLPELYCQCDVALVLSFSNLSLLPLELMACGVPVVSNRAPYTEWLLNDGNSRLERPTVPALSGAICDLLQNPQVAERQRAGGFQTSAATDWAEEGRRLGAILSGLAGTAPARLQTRIDS